MGNSFKEWLERFLEEKDIDKSDFTFFYKGQTHIMDFDYFKDLLLNAPLQEKKAIKSKIVYLDFKNGNIRDFFEHLFMGYIKLNY